MLTLLRYWRIRNGLKNIEDLRVFVGMEYLLKHMRSNKAEIGLLTRDVYMSKSLAVYLGS